MRRPLLVAALCLVAIAAIRLETGAAAHPGSISAGELEAAGTLLVTGQVYQKEEQSIYLKSVFISDANATWQTESQQEILLEKNLLNEKLICETEQASEIPLGSTVTLSGVFMSFSFATNPGEFDTAVYYRTLGIGGKLRKAEILSKGEDYWVVREGLYQFKSYLKARLYQILPQKEAAVMAALLLGDKKDLNSELKNLYKQNGILHILSISSLHITIIGMGVYKLLRKMRMPIPLAAVGGSVLLILYGTMTGFGVSACRAIGMYLIRMLGEVIGRTYDMLTALGVMAAVMVTVNPWYLQNGGFLLSFASVLGIGVVYPALLPEKQEAVNIGKFPGLLGKFLKRIEQVPKKLVQSAVASLSITLTTLPIQLWLYYEVPVYSVLLNLLIIPLLKPMMVAGILALIPGLGGLSSIARFILEGYEGLCGLFIRLPFHTWNPGCPSAWQIVLYYLLLFCLAAIRYYGKKRKKKIPKKGKNIVTLCLAVLLFGIRPSSINSVTFLDVGQGDCILVRTASGQNYLFDCGSSSRSSVGKYVLIPYLKYNGIHTIDAIFLSHPDADHVNGALELLTLGREEGILVKQLLLPAIEEGARQEAFGELLKAASEQGNTVAVGYLATGERWDCGNAVFTCLHPSQGYQADNANAYSECFYVEFMRDNSPEGTLLLTGDVEGSGEEALLEELVTRNIGGITVLKAAHHGSRNSSSREFLCQVNPSLTVISCGRNNRYGHPHEELLERLEETDTYILQTSQFGAVTITFQDGSLRVQAMLTAPQ